MEKETSFLFFLSFFFFLFFFQNQFHHETFFFFKIYGYILGIFQKEKLVELLNVSEEEFFGFIVDIDRGYFDNPYHSFYHCVDVFHIVYYCLSTLEAGDYFSKLKKKLYSNL